ncbi:unnamed protein product [Dicrocoelium dendriticum]|nr:unnamed protein product [Dicrocoelium dendriticum]
MDRFPLGLKLLTSGCATTELTFLQKYPVNYPTMVHFYNLALLILLSLSIFNKPISVVSQQDDEDYEEEEEEEELQEEIDEEDELEKRDHIPESLYRNGPEYDAGIDEFVDLV